MRWSHEDYWVTIRKYFELIRAIRNRKCHRVITVIIMQKYRVISRRMQQYQKAVHHEVSHILKVSLKSPNNLAKARNPMKSESDPEEPMNLINRIILITKQAYFSFFFFFFFLFWENFKPCHSEHRRRPRWCQEYRWPLGCSAVVQNSTRIGGLLELLRFLGFFGWLRILGITRS